jgi:hypothetical protein
MRIKMRGFKENNNGPNGKNRKKFQKTLNH